jgi:hypothetical protein
MSHAAPTDLIKPPKLDVRLAVHTLRKMRCRNGDRAETDMPDASGAVAGMEIPIKAEEICQDITR